MMAATSIPVAHVVGGVEVLELLPVAALLGLYAGRAHALRRRGRAVPAWREICFASGIALIGVAVLSPLASLDDELVWVHMVQHLVLGDLSALMIVLGLTGPLLQPVLAAPGLGWLRAIVHPTIALPLWLANLYLWHLPALYQAVLSSEALHGLEHVSFVAFEIVMWMALLGPLPKPAWFGNSARLMYIVLVRLWGAILATALLWTGSALYPDYASGEAARGISPLADQGLAGIVMMVEQGIVTQVTAQVKLQCPGGSATQATLVRDEPGTQEASRG